MVLGSCTAVVTLISNVLSRIGVQFLLQRIEVIPSKP